MSVTYLLKLDLDDLSKRQFTVKCVNLQGMLQSFFYHQK